jgi:hypothetical protein
MESESALSIELESALRTIGVRAREIADSAVQCENIAHTAREATLGRAWTRRWLRQQSSSKDKHGAI